MSKTPETFGSVELRGNAGCVVGALALIGALAALAAVGILIGALTTALIDTAFRVASWSVTP